MIKKRRGREIWWRGQKKPGRLNLVGEGVGKGADRDSQRATMHEDGRHEHRIVRTSGWLRQVAEDESGKPSIEKPYLGTGALWKPRTKTQVPRDRSGEGDEGRGRVNSSEKADEH